MTTPHVTDAVLLRRIADGDTQAFECLYHRYVAQVLSFLISIDRDRQRAEDVSQEVWKKVWCKAGKFDAARSDATARAWIFTIASNTARDAGRAQARAAAGPAGDDDGDDSPVFLVADREPTPRERAEAREQAEHHRLHIRACLDQLPDRWRALFHLVYQEGLTIADAARMLDIPFGSAQSLTGRIRARLRQCLEGKGVLV